MIGIFEDAEQAAELQCDNQGNLICDVLDTPFPLEEGLVTTLIEMTVKLLSGSIYKPVDSTNNSSDDLAQIASFLRRNLKSQL